MNIKLSPVRIVAMVLGVALFTAGVVIALIGTPPLAQAKSEVDTGTHMMSPGLAMPDATYPVTNTNASGPGSLYQAILNANANAGTDTITFAPTVSGTIMLTGSLSINSGTLTINGPGANVLAVSGANAYRVFYIDEVAAATITDLTIRDGKAEGDYGGGIGNLGTLALSNANIISNSARFGGGISNGGVLTLTNSTASYNTATYGGGITNWGSTLTLINSTLSGNQATIPFAGGGGAMDLYGELSTVIIVNSTIVSNTAFNTGFSGIYLENGNFTIRNSIVAHNGVTNNFWIDSSAVFTSAGYNLTNSGAGTPFTAATDLTNTDPLLGPLQDNGGSRWMHALSPGSPALDRIPFSVNGCGTTITTDQRGWSRPWPAGGQCDIGAYEAHLAFCVAQFGAGTIYSSGDASALQSAVDAVIPGSTIKVAGTCAGVQSRAGMTQTVFITKGLTMHGGYGPILAGYWKFDEGSGATANDSSGYGNIGTVTGAIYTSTNRAPTSFANVSALNFVTSTDRVATPLVTTARDNVTLAAWVNWKGTTGHDEVIVLNGHGAYSGYGLTLWNGHSDHVSLMVSGIAFGDSGVALPIGTWQHVALVRAGGVWKIYVNGVLAAPTWTNTPNTPDTGTFIGNDQNSAIRFNGLIDDVRIYNSALSAAQIAALAGGNDVTTNWTTSDPVANPTILDAKQGGRVIYLTGGSGVSLTLENLTVQSGLIRGIGGGIYNHDANLTLSNTIVRDNATPYCTDDDVCYGGGVYIDAGNLLVSGGQILSNTSPDGGGVFINSGSATLSNVQILGNLATSGGGMFINSGSATLSNMQILSNTAYAGGGIIVQSGSTTLSNVQILSNQAHNGGGVYVFGNGTMIVTGGQVVSNSANSRGGGMFVVSGALVVTNTTVSRNQANSLSDGGGAIYQISGRSTIANSTIVSNTAANASRSGIWLRAGTLEIGNSIIALNGITNNVVISDGTFTSLGYNLTNSGAGTPFTGPTDLTNTHPLLGPLQDNGGSTWTYALLPHSPALDRIPFGLNGCGTTIAIDQRGRLRPALPGGQCDIGAYEAYEYLRFVYLPLIVK